MQERGRREGTREEKLARGAEEWLDSARLLPVQIRRFLLARIEQLHHLITQLRTHVHRINQAYSNAQSGVMAIGSR
ncbi:hypothetical protein EYF80_039787 [Liparis tanakae]|uniref:Uncharacterized protein n=1 Tax=Liparis tanakae TaxID=230148 RepID=A0A4Z2G8X2_9TELE|nr:hypothetical protein EYF80_039787 [Liparis tanakae]